MLERLHGRLDGLVDLFMDRVQEIPEYAGKRVGLAELRDTARETFRSLVDGLRDKELQQPAATVTTIR